MILVRVVFRARHGKVNQVISTLKEAVPHMPQGTRLFSDLSGPIDTVVLETVHESLGAWEQERAAMFKREAYVNSEPMMDQAIESAYQEYFTIEAG